MKIKTQLGHLIDIFGIYWIKNISDKETHTYFLGLSKGNGGLSPYSMDEIAEIIEPELSENFIYYNNNAHGIYHESLIKEKLLDDLLEYDETAYQRFLEILKAEGRIEADFY